MAETFFAEIQRYIGFSEATAATLRAAYGRLAPRLGDVIDVHYDRIVEHEGARGVLTGGPEQITRLKQTFHVWLHRCFTGPHDEEYFSLRSDIGLTHVRIRLPQRYMVTSMAVMRSALHQVVVELFTDAERDAVHDAVDKVLSLDLAIMLESYQNDTLERLARTERLATLGQIGATIGHELRNPLSVIGSSAYLLRKRVADDTQALRHLHKIEQHVEHANRSVANLLALVRDAPPQLGQWSVSALFREAIDAADLPQAVDVAFDGPDASVRADRGQVVQALRNVLVNAGEAMNGRGLIRVTQSREGDMIVVHVDDQGPGFGAAVVSRLFEPLVTTKPLGVGLGLALTKRLVERQPGTVTATNLARGGARLTITLPAVDRIDEAAS